MGVFSSFVSFAQDTDCEHIIAPPSAFDRVLEAAENYSRDGLLPNLTYLPTAMDELKLTSEEDRAVFSKALAIKPMIDSGIFYESVVAEASMLGYQDEKKIASMIKSFALISLAEKKSLVDGILESILFAIGGKVSITNVDVLAKKAKRFRLSEEEMVVVYKTFQSLEKTDYDEVRIVILDMLRQPSQQLIKEVLKYRNVFSSGLFRTPHPLRPGNVTVRILRAKNGVNPDALVKSFTAIDALKSQEKTFHAAKAIWTENQDSLSSKGYLKLGLATVQVTERFNVAYWYSAVLKVAMPANSYLMEEDDFLKLALAILKQTRKMTDHQETYNVISWVVKIAQQRKSLSTKSETAIKNEIIDHVNKLFKDDQVADKTLKLIAAPLID